MFARLSVLRKPSALFAVLAAFTLASCASVPMIGAGSGPRVNASQPVPVALLLPQTDAGGAGGVAQSMENAARLAAASLQGAEVDLRVYDTQGTPAGASAAARAALDGGAQVIVGPLYSQSISAVTPVVAGRDVSVLSLSNNAAVAGGNVFVLGQTFYDVADRLTSFARRQGRSAIAVVHGADVGGTAGRDAITAAAQAAGMRVATVQSYPLSQRGITEAGPRIAEAVRQSGADAVFLTASADADLPMIASVLPENGVSPGQVRYLGLTRWNASGAALSLPGLQGGLFALPDQQAVAAFESRYQAAYGSAPHPLAGLAFDAVSAIGALVATGRSNALSPASLTRRQGFRGAYGAFRLLSNGTNDRALAVAQIQNNQVVILDPAPTSFGAAGF